MFKQLDVTVVAGRWADHNKDTGQRELRSPGREKLLVEGGLMAARTLDKEENSQVLEQRLQQLLHLFSHNYP